MLDLDRLERIKLSAEPKVQRALAIGFLGPNYLLPPRVDITIENPERIPDGSVIYAMNHTDRYNYWPFQFQLWRTMRRYTATWVKGKYYENAFIGKFMEVTNNIPTVSRGYLITRDFLAVVGRRPDNDEYKALRGAVDAAAGIAPIDATTPPLSTVPDAVLQTPRNTLGRRFEPDEEEYPDYLNALFRRMMERFVELNGIAFKKGLDLLIFPQGTRSIRLSRGHIGLAEVALHFKKTIVPVGCNGSDKLYPGESPVAKPGRVVYRIGTPLRYDDLSKWHTDEPFQPFTFEAESRHRMKFQGLVDHVMQEINGLLDEPYRFAEDRSSDGVRGSERFV